MKIDPADFSYLVDRALTNEQLANMRPVIEKELLHYDILFCLDQEGLLDKLVFQGGTALRLCYGGKRFSEDLGFAGGTDFSSKQLSSMKACIEDYLGKRYGLEVFIKEPASLKSDPQYAELKVDKWQISIVTAPDRKDVPRQRIKLEVANIPAYTRTTQSLLKNYDFLPDGYEDTLIYVETLNEIMADKLIALPATRRYVRYRDFWDLIWLKQQGAVLDEKLVARKIKDYQLTDFEQALTERIESFSKILASGELESEMKRFIPTDVYDRTLAKDKFLGYLDITLHELFKQLQSRLYAEPDKGNEFLL
ncbi:MAG: nucleotidyl transferase AbiEii/AbiGii toxin family protein [Endozoicomonas sp.]|uniref:nucleotidyl transferase AbiEii/AbiGii toxin family protein n=1 Tax=Endozoicomonas sp. TaxID=1892382 RepID=UPI003D9BB252